MERSVIDITRRKEKKSDSRINEKTGLRNVEEIIQERNWKWTGQLGWTNGGPTKYNPVANY